jgi:site-specific DNA recombinase
LRRPHAVVSMSTILSADRALGVRWYPPPMMMPPIRAARWSARPCSGSSPISPPGLSTSWLSTRYRLTRALADFAKIVEVFDRQGVSFVSVTQQFNTTTSMGRLTLNVLLSFAQFEREVTGERIRDKIAASKKKGLWMGGFVPLGYRPDQRTLVIHDAEADIVLTIFALYCETGSVAKVEAELARRGIARPESTAITSGRAYGGRSFARGEIYKLLSNPIYVGVGHKGHRYDGQHPAIIDRDTWTQVRARLATNTHARHIRLGATDPSLLAVVVRDQRRPMESNSAWHAHLF